MPLAVITFRSSGTGSRTGQNTMQPCANRAASRSGSLTRRLRLGGLSPARHAVVSRTIRPLAIRTALTLRVVFRLALRQTEGLIGSILRLLGLDLAVPDHSTLSRRAEALEVPRPIARTGSVHLLVDSTRLRLCGPGEWLIEKHGTRRRRSWRKLHIGVDAETGQILASELTSSDIDDSSQVGPLLDQIPSPLASFVGDGAYDQSGIYSTVTERDPDADVIVPPRSTAVLNDMAEGTPTQRDRHLQSIAEHGRMGWQKKSGYTRRALVETSISRSNE
jgi:hypothetical protein